MTPRQEVIRFAKANRMSAKPMSGGVHLHKARGSDWRNDYSRFCDSWDEARAYLAGIIAEVQDGVRRSYPWDAA
jgi:hypothetical protein